MRNFELLEAFPGKIIQGTELNKDTCHAIFSALTAYRGCNYYVKTHSIKHGSSLINLRDKVINTDIFFKPSTTPIKFTGDGYVAYVFGFSPSENRITDSAGRPTQFHHAAIYAPEIGERIDPKKVVHNIQKAYLAAMDGYTLSIPRTRLAPAHTIKFEAKHWGNEEFTDAATHFLGMLKSILKDWATKEEDYMRISVWLDLLPITHTNEFDARLEDIVKEIQTKDAA